MIRCLGWLAVVLTCMVVGPSLGRAQGAASVLREHAEAGRLEAGEQALSRMALANAADAEARMALGLIQFARAVEKLGQNLHQYGLQPPRQPLIPILRMPVPLNTSPEPLDYAKLRAVYATFLADIAAAERTLAAMPAGEPKLVINLANVRLDLDRNGRADEAESLGRILAALSGARGEMPALEVAFDRADATWLRGYVNLLSAFLEFVLAYDWSETFAATGHHFFLGARDPANPLHGAAEPNPLLGRDGASIADAIALVHLVRWPLAEPDRMKRALAHLRQVPVLSRQNWREILAETDDDREWLPNPNQKNRAFTGLPVRQDLVDGWMRVMDEFEEMLEGRKLMAHWRLAKGIDMKAFFEQPRPFDLVLWMTGHAAAPYLRDGPMVTGETARQWQVIFGGNFLTYAFWFN